MDWNNDGKYDLIVGCMEGGVWLYLNTGTKENPELSNGEKIKAGGEEIGSRIEFTGNGTFMMGEGQDFSKLYSNINYADLNKDGLNDLIIGNASKIYLYRNIGKAGTPQFAKGEVLPVPEKNYDIKSSPMVIDWDGDGKNDLLLSNGKLLLYRNSGSNEKPVYDAPVILKTLDEEFDKHFYKRVSMVDWNNDGKMDLLIGTSYLVGTNEMNGNIWLFLGK